ncbi:MAG: DUF1893 domain-containing protein [Lachnospiraceae bacterium]|nr:DUF1893 domain-containing protein [Lachnospiraceae bacterium]
MKEVLTKAKNILEEDGYTCVIIKYGHKYTSRDRGVKPLLEYIDKKIDLEGAFAADKVVGKAAAYLYVLLKVEEVYAGIISKPAYEVFHKYGIKAYYDQMVVAIRNREDNGYCPMESAVMDIDNPQDALDAIIETKKKLEK